MHGPSHDNELEEHGAFLRRLAYALAGREDAAEDLVQDAWLAAIARPPRAGWDLRRWLAGVVRNRARHERRSAERRAERERTSARGSEVSPASDCAARLELTRRIVEATEALAPAYREVVLLRFFDGLAPREIAKRLGVPVNTVRTRLRRALAHLRAALDRAYGDPEAWPALLVPFGLRHPVLAWPAAAAPASGAALAGVTLMVAKTKLVLAGVLSAGVVLAWSFWGRDASPVAPLERTSLTRDADGARGVAAAGQHVAHPRRDAVATEDEESSVLVTGRLLDAQSRAPIPAAEVRFELWGGVAEHLASAWDAPSPVRSDAHGRYQLAVRYDPQLRFSVWFEAPAHLVAVASYDEGSLRAGRTIDHGDVLLPPAVPVTIRVVDDRDQPVAGYEVQLDGPRLEIGSAEVSVARYGMVRTQGDGTLEQKRFWPGAWRVLSDDAQFLRFVGPERFELAPSDHGRTILLRVEPQAGRFTIAGRVTDEAGLVMAGVELAVPTRQGYRTAESDARGRFVLAALLPEESPHRLALWRSHAQRTLELASPQQDIAIGTNDLKVVVRRREPARLRLEVVDDDGAPVERYAFALVPVLHGDGATLLDGSARLGRPVTPAQRVVDLERVPGSYLLFVRAADAGLAPALHESLELLEGQRHEARVVLSRRVAWRVHVNDADGRGIEGSHVELREALGRGDPGGFAHAQQLADLLDRGRRSSSCSVITASGESGRDGSVTLRTARTIGVAEVSVTSPGYLPARVRVGPHPPSEPLEIRLAHGARVEVALGPQEVLQAWGERTELRLKPANPQSDTRSVALAPGGAMRVDGVIGTLQVLEDAPPWADPNTLALPRADDQASRSATRTRAGLVEFDAVPPGDWFLEIGLAMPSQWHNARLAEINDLRSGETRRLTVDVADLRPASLQATVLLDGQVPRSATLRVSNVGTFDIDAHGRSIIEHLPAGAYDYCLKVQRSGATVFVPADSKLSVESGRRYDVTLAFARRSLTVECVDARGKPLAGQRLSLRPCDGAVGRLYHLLRPHVTDARGRATFDWVPAPAVDVVRWDDDVSEAHTTLPDDAATTTIESGVTVVGKSRTIRVVHAER